MTTAHIHRIATAIPPHDVHRPFVEFAETLLPQGTVRSLFKRMARLSAIEHRYSYVEPVSNGDATWHDREELYVAGAFPTTARRMEAFEKHARSCRYYSSRIGAITQPAPAFGAEYHAVLG